MAASRYNVLEALVQPQEDLQWMRVYFRSNRGSEFYHVEMTRKDDAYRAILPMPDADAEEVVYYIEAMDASSETARTREFHSEVVEEALECKQRDPSVVYFVGDEPGIVLGSSAAGAPIPPGFQAAGIIELVPPAVVAAEGGVGLRVLTIAGAAAGAVGVGLLVSDGEGGSGAMDLPSGSTTTTTTTIALEPAVVACFDAPRTATVGEGVRMDASCSQPRGSLEYDWSLGNGKTRQGRVINTAYTEPGRYVIELTVRRGTGTGIGDRDSIARELIVTGSDDSPSADLSVHKTGSYITRIVDGVLRFIITYSIEVRNFGPDKARDISLVDVLPPTVVFENASPPCAQSGGTVRCDLGALGVGSSTTVSIEVYAFGVAEGTTVINTVSVIGKLDDPNPLNNTDTEETLLTRTSQTLSSVATEEQSVFSSFLDLESTSGPGETVVGQIQINRTQLDRVTSGGLYRHHAWCKPGNNVVEAYASLRSKVGALWRFDFSGMELFLPGSIRVSTGQVVAIDAFSVVFRLREGLDERISFEYSLSTPIRQPGGGPRAAPGVGHQ